jgi:hypothetical protein
MVLLTRLPDDICRYFQNKIPIWVNFGGWKMLDYFMTIWSYLRPIGIFVPFGILHGYLAYISRFGKLHQEKSGNPGTALHSTLIGF